MHEVNFNVYRTITGILNVLSTDISEPIKSRIATQAQKMIDSDNFFFLSVINLWNPLLPSVISLLGFYF